MGGSVFAWWWPGWHSGPLPPTVWVAQRSQSAAPHFTQRTAPLASRVHVQYMSSGYRGSIGPARSSARGIGVSIGLMPSLVLIVLVWVVLPVAMYRTVNAASGSVLLGAAAAPASLVVAVVALERGFRVGEARLQGRRNRRGTFS